MAVWQYIEILKKQKKGFLFKKDNLEERLIALNKISESGEPDTICSLIPFLKDKEIQNATCHTIIHLFKKIGTKKGYYNTLKHCDISKSDIDYYSQNFSREECITLYLIAALNGSGYVREKAVKKLGETNSEHAIPFIVYRLADWVPAVRQTALQALENFKKNEFIQALLDNLMIFEWLQKVERADLSSVRNDIMNFIVAENKDYVIEHFTTFTDRIRIIIARQITATENIGPEDLKMLLSDKHFLVRNFAVSHFDKLTQAEIDKLLIDRSARVRMQTLYHLSKRDDFSKIVFPFLSDNSASIRDFARYSLKNEIPDFGAIYNENLKNNRNIIGSLNGLAEINGKNFVETIVPFLKHNKIRIRKTAFLALKQLDNSKAYDFAFQNLDSEYIGIRNIIIEYFSNTSALEVLQKAREAYTNGNYDVKISMLRLFNKIGKWTAIGDIMIGTIDEDENIRQLSLDYIQEWRKKATSYFTQPKQEELERANQIFRLAFELHEEKKYFDQNPLAEIDFYLR